MDIRNRNLECLVYGFFTFVEIFKAIVVLEVCNANYIVGVFPVIRMETNADDVDIRAVVEQLIK